MSALSQVQILERLGELFRPGTYDEAKVHHARYDLRLAKNLLMIPVGTTERQLVKDGDALGPAEYTGQTFTLQPGETAFLSPIEEFRMPHDLVGLLALRPKYAREGIILLSGQFVDPGYGAETWTPGGHGARLGRRRDQSVVLCRCEPRL